MIVEGTVSPDTLLKAYRRFLRLNQIILVFLGIPAGIGIDLFQIRYRKRRFLRIFPFKALIKIRKLRLTLFQLCDDQTDLKTPVTEMHITQDMISHKTVNPLDALSDDSRTEMPYMKGLRYIRPTVIDHHGSRFC